MAYDEALKRRPPVEVIAETAELEERLGDFERAAKLYGWAQRRQPDNPQWRALRAEALMRAGKFDRAGRILRFALKRFPDHPRLNALMGLWHARRVEWVEAEPFLLKGIGDLDNPDLEAVGALVEIWLCQGRVSETLRLCEMLLQKRPLSGSLDLVGAGDGRIGQNERSRFAVGALPNVRQRRCPHRASGGETLGTGERTRKGGSGLGAVCAKRSQRANETGGADAGGASVGAGERFPESVRPAGQSDGDQR
jgi:tetratricopeptide (TPR) repeat protein